MILYWESQVGQVRFTTSDRLSLSQMTLFCLFSFTRQFVSLIAQGWRCLVFSGLSSFTFVWCCWVLMCLLLVCVCYPVLGESSGTGLFYHFRQALPVTDDIVLPIISFTRPCVSLIAQGWHCLVFYVFRLSLLFSAVECCCC